MSELYWLYVLGSLHEGLYGLAVLSFICSCVCVFIYFVSLQDSEKIDKRFKVVTKYILPMAVIISMLGAMFIPDTKSLYIIYGVGGTLDYLKENKTAKQIPDKAILALDKYLNEQLGGHKGDTNNENNQIQRKDR